MLGTRSASSEGVCHLRDAVLLLNPGIGRSMSPSRLRTPDDSISFSNIVPFVSLRDSANTWSPQWCVGRSFEPHGFLQFRDTSNDFTPFWNLLPFSSFHCVEYYGMCIQWGRLRFPELESSELEISAWTENMKLKPSTMTELEIYCCEDGKYIHKHIH